MMKWPFKVLSEEPTLQGLLRTRTTALYHPESGRENRARGIERECKRHRAGG